MPKLYELTDQFKNLIDLLDNPMVANEEVLNAAIAIEGELHEKIQNIAKLIKNLESDADGFAAEKKRLADQERHYRNRIESLKQYLSLSMTTAGIKKVDGTVPVAFRKSPPSVEIVDPFIVPAKYQKPQEPEFDKRAILEDLKAGKEIPGAVLISDKEYLKIG